MEFRWVALLALWTILSGPILGGPSGKASRGKDRLSAVTPAKYSPKPGEVSTRR